MKVAAMLYVFLLLVVPAYSSGMLCTFLLATFPELYKDYCHNSLLTTDHDVCLNVSSGRVGTVDYFSLTYEQRKINNRDRSVKYYFNATCERDPLIRIIWNLVSLKIYGPNLRMLDGYGLQPNNRTFDDQRGTIPFPLDLSLALLVLPLVGSPGLKHLEFGDILAPISFPNILDAPFQLPPLIFAPDVCHVFVLFIA
jgi:hypothetical protein